MTVASDLELYFLDLINGTRAALGLDALVLELNLNTAAETHSQWMADTNTLSHTGAGGSTATDRIADAGYDMGSSYTVHENLGITSVGLSGGTLEDDLALMYEGLLASPAHYAALTATDVTYVGIGLVQDDFTGTDLDGQVGTYDSLLVTMDFAASNGVADLDLHGGSGAEALTGGAGTDYINGGGGNDTLTGAGGNDTIDGDTGTDTAVLSVARSTATVTEITGGVRITSALGTDVYYNVESFRFSDVTQSLSQLLSWTAPVPAGRLLEGTEGDNTLTGGAGADTISGDKGDDFIVAGAGDDDVWGDGGNDTIYGGDGDDTLRGGREEDAIYGEGGNDIVSGQSNADTLHGGAGSDTVRGGGGGDLMYGDAGADILKGGTYQDTIYGGDGNDLLSGNRHDDDLHGGNGNDTLFGGGDDDTLTGDAGNDDLKGGDGADVFVFATGHGDDTIRDFDITEDTLELSSALVDGMSATQIVAQASVTADGVLIEIDGTSILLEDLTTTAGLAAAIDIV